MDWSEQQLARLRDPYLLDKLQEFAVQYNQVKTEFAKILHTHTDTFGNISEASFAELFKWSFKYVMTRRMQISTQYEKTFLVPFADFINHG